MRKIAITVILSALILCNSQMAFSATPAIDLDNFGVTAFYTTDYRSKGYKESAKKEIESSSKKDEAKKKKKD